MHLASGGNLAKALTRLAAGELLILDADGAYQGGYVEGHGGPIRILGNGARVAGGLKLERCGPVILEALLLNDAPHHGLMVVECTSLSAVMLECHRSQGSGILTARTGLVTVDHCQARGNVQHGVYVSEGGDHIRITLNDLRRNHRCGCQVNANPNRSRDVEIIGNDLRRNRNAGVQLAGVSHGRVTRNEVGGCRQGVVCWDDGEGDRLACHDLDLSEQVGPFNIARNSTGIRLPEKLG